MGVHRSANCSFLTYYLLRLSIKIGKLAFWNKKQLSTTHPLPSYFFFALFYTQVWKSLSNFPSSNALIRMFFWLMLNSAKQNIITFYNNFQQTFEQPGVKAPGTANRTPFLPANNSAMLTLPFGVPSMTWTDGSLSPTCYIIDDFLFSTNLTYICILPGCTENY